LFFGRDGQSEQLIGKLGRTRFLAVVGTSGSGKSSLVRAGLRPALLGGFMTSAGSDWRVAIMRPGNDPVGNLAQALNASDVFGSEIEENAAIQTAIGEATLRRGSLGLVDAVRQAAMPKNENLLVLVDQFEEIFRFARVTQGEAYHNEAAAFVKLILEASQQREVPIFVVLTMRSDYLGDCSQFWDLPEAINESQYLIPRLTRDQLREAITGPVAVGGATIAPRLVNRLLNDVGDDQDQLPILQHALMRTWDQWKEDHQEDEPLDLAGYEAIGTMSNALSDHADEAYAELTDERSKEIAEKTFKGLTEKGSDNREVRRPIELKELCALGDASEAEVIAVIEVFRKEGRSFLMPAGVGLTGASLIDISHESLIRNWKRLKEWVEQESRSARIYGRLAETAVLHSEGRAGLWRDPDLQIALTWREQSKPNQVWAQRYHRDFGSAMSFLDQSVAARDAEIRDKEKERKRGIKRTRITASVFAFLFLVSLVALIFAIQQSATAKQQTVRANDLLELVTLNAEEAKNNAVKEAQARLAREQAEQEQMVARRQGQEARRLQLIADDQRREAIKQKGIAMQFAKEAMSLMGNAQQSESNTLAALKQLTEQKLKTEAALKQKSDLVVALEKEKVAAEQARLAADRARDTAEQALADLKNEQQKSASIAAEQKTLLTSIEDASSAPATSTGKLRLRLKNAYGEFLNEQVEISLRNQSGSGVSAFRNLDASKAILISDLVAAAPKGIYQINIASPSYLPVTRFVSVKPNGISETTITLALDPTKVGKVEFPKYEDLPAEAQTLLKVSKNVDGNEGKMGEGLYESLDDVRRAGLLNLIAKCKAISLEGPKSVLSYLRELREIRGDRIFAVVDQDLRGLVKSSQITEFIQVSQSLFKPSPGYFTDAGSFKTQDQYAKLQLTFFTNEKTWLADLSIDSGGGLAQVFLVSRDKLTGRGTHPYEIQQLLMTQGVDPGYRLRR
ncbi:MAG: hypothetical protein AABO57_17840, partial [Acidobacteriota bacterium]